MAAALLLQVFSGALGPSHPRTLVAARNAQHIKHKLIKLPAEPQELLQYCNKPITETGTAAAARRQGKAAGSKAGKGNARAGVSSSSSNSKKRRGRKRGAGASDDDDAASSSSSGLAAGTSSDDSSSGKSPGRGRSNKGKVAAGAAGRAVQPDTSSKRAVQRSGSMQERLQAIMKSRKQQPGSSDGSAEAAALSPIAEAGGKQCKQQQQQQPTEWREYTHVDHLGAGVFRASQQQRALYESLKPDIEAHARAASCLVGSSRSSSSSGVGQIGSGSSCGVVEMQVLLPAVVPARPASASPPPMSNQQQQQQHGLAAGSPEAAAAAAAAVPAGHLLRRGPLLDATIAKVKKPLTVEQARKLRRQQQQAAGKRAPGGLLDKLY
jgi:hypothetical protein